jgi:hypothetical protein
MNSAYDPSRSAPAPSCVGPGGAAAVPQRCPLPRRPLARSRLSALVAGVCPPPSPASTARKFKDELVLRPEEEQPSPGRLARRSAADGGRRSQRPAAAEEETGGHLDILQKTL